MTDLDNPNSDALQGFMDGVEDQLSGEEEAPWIVYGPRWAQDKGAGSPPKNIEEPVWAPSAGWMEKGEAPIRGETDGPLALYAPDSNEELDVEA